MTRYVFKMPDLGEGTVEAEIVAWHVKVGDHIAEDEVMAEVMTEKAAVEVPAPVTGRVVVSLTGGPGDMVRVGAELVVFETEGGDEAAAAAAARPHPHRRSAPAPHRSTPRLERPQTVRSGATPAPSPPEAVTGTREGGARPARHGVAGVAPPRARSGDRSGAGARQRPARPHHAPGHRRRA